MQPDNLNVFDFDGTLIKVNSFREITKSLLSTLLKKLQIRPLLALTAWYLLRKSKTISHLKFKKRVVGIFEKSLSEEEKRNISQMVFDNNVNEAVLEQMLKSDSCIVCTASPFAYVSRVSFGKEVVIIGSLNSQNSLPKADNVGVEKIENIKAYFNGQNIRIVNFYTDSGEDQPLIDFAVNAFLCKNGRLVKVK